MRQTFHLNNWIQIIIFFFLCFQGDFNGYWRGNKSNEFFLANLINVTETMNQTKKFKIKNRLKKNFNTFYLLMKLFKAISKAEKNLSTIVRVLFSSSISLSLFFISLTTNKSKFLSKIFIFLLIYEIKIKLKFNIKKCTTSNQ